MGWRTNYSVFTTISNGLGALRDNEMKFILVE
jgi:hypothetical protein